MLDYRVKNRTINNIASFILKSRIGFIFKNVLKNNAYPFLERLGVVKTIRDYDKNFELLEAILKEAKMTAPGERLGVLVIPSKNIASNYLERQFGSRLAQVLEAQGIPYRSLVSDGEKDPGIYFEGEGHFNERGHAVAAKALGEVLEELR
ncbi:MAG: hypothetical protein AAB495_03630 [Patescibacteria group bacterium]